MEAAGRNVTPPNLAKVPFYEFGELSRPYPLYVSLTSNHTAYRQNESPTRERLGIDISQRFSVGHSTIAGMGKPSPGIVGSNGLECFDNRRAPAEVGILCPVGAASTVTSGSSWLR